MSKSKLVSVQLLVEGSRVFSRGSIILWRVHFCCYSVMSYRLACVASVSNRVIPFLLSSQLSRRARAETLATQATYLHAEISDKIKQKCAKNKHSSDRQENLKRFIFLHQKFTIIETQSSLNFRRLLRVVVYLNLVLSTANVGYVWSVKFTHSLRSTSSRSTSVLQFFSLPIPDHSSSILDPRSSILDPRSPFLIFYFWILISVSILCKCQCTNYPAKTKRKHLFLLALALFAAGDEVLSGKREDPGDKLDISYGSHFGKGPRHDCNFWIWSVKVND